MVGGLPRAAAGLQDAKRKLSSNSTRAKSIGNTQARVDARMTKRRKTTGDRAAAAERVGLLNAEDC